MSPNMVFGGIYMIIAVDVSLSIWSVPSQAMFQSSPFDSFSEYDGTLIFTFLNKYSFLLSSNTRQTCSNVPLPGWPLVLLNRIE